MIDDLVCTISQLSPNQELVVISPYYDRNRQGRSDYLAADGIVYSGNLSVRLANGSQVSLGIHKGYYKPNVQVVFFHNASYFPHLYPSFDPYMMVSFLSVIALAVHGIVLDVLHISPAIILSNDWGTGLVPAFMKRVDRYARQYKTMGTKSIHVVHNLDPTYEGRIYLRGNLSPWDLHCLHGLPSELLVDPFWTDWCINPSRCALLECDNWATVSWSYRDELLLSSPLRNILKLKPEPFAHPNGIPLDARLERLKSIKGVPSLSHSGAKKEVQRRLFGMSDGDPSLVVMGFVGRITRQKGVHLIAEVAERIIRKYSFRVQIVVAGMAAPDEEYAAHVSVRLNELTRKFPRNFWANPSKFFTDGPLLNLGADFGLMPSLFEPGGIVQQEFLVAGTPVIAFRTGGLKDTIKEFIPHTASGNGFTFEAYEVSDFEYAIDRAIRAYLNPDSSLYVSLRNNARNSVMTLDAVGLAWLQEFYRMHGRQYHRDPLSAPMFCKTSHGSSNPHLLSLTNGGSGHPDHDGTTAGQRRLSMQSSGGGSDDGTGVNVPTYMSVPSPVNNKRTQSLEIAKGMHRSASYSLNGVLSRVDSAGALMSRERSYGSLAVSAVKIVYPISAKDPRPDLVLMTGSFDNWITKIPMGWDDSVFGYSATLRIPSGRHFFKFIVDGKWCCSSHYITEQDGAGNSNNVVVVL